MIAPRVHPSEKGHARHIWETRPPRSSRGSAGGAGKWSYTVGTQGHYAACTAVSGCIVHDYPWLQLKVLGNGSWTKTSGTG